MLDVAQRTVGQTSAPEGSEPATAYNPTAAEPQSDQTAPLGDTIVPQEYLVLPAVGQYGRSPLHRDAVEAQLVTGQWKMPTAGDSVEWNGKKEVWSATKADDAGQIDTRLARGGWAVTTFESSADRIMLLEAAGHAAVYINGEPRTGDPYHVGWLKLPVRVQAGNNTLLFHLAGDTLSARLDQPTTGVVFLEEDRTIPTLVQGETEPVWAAVPIVNATSNWLENLTLQCRRDAGEWLATPVAPIPPLSVRKASLILMIAEGASEPVRYRIRLVQQSETADKPPNSAADGVLVESSIKLPVVSQGGAHVRTFRSGIDGSVQSYAVRPASGPSDDTLPGIVLALHSAGESCDDYVAKFAAKPWAHIVAPQGRRPYGFDWEGWSRADAMEALADARERYANDPRRTYITGHSMGGHGCWHLGVTYPDQFAAIGPSGAWASFWSYGGGIPSFENPTAIQSLLLRGYSSSDTLQLLRNLAGTGVYVLHGAADEIVPVEQARFLRGRLAEFHPNFVYFEQPEAAHWWGNECCDWPRMMEFFRHLSTPAPAEPIEVDFTVVNPAISSRCQWASIEAQERQLAPSRVTLRQDRRARTFVGTTSNVARLALDVSHLPANQPIDVTLDGQSLSWLNWPADSHVLWFDRDDGRWSVAEPASPQVKGSNRYGTFNAAFDHQALLVYGTGGTEEENAWAAAKARYDAETFWYRGGGSLEVLPDRRFDLNRDTDRNIILYGNSATNAAWPKLLATSPVEVKPGEVRVGSRVERGNDLAVVMVRPRPGSDTALVGVIGGTGPVGMRRTDRLRWFVSGVVYPDLMILGPDVVSEGTADLRAWGYFGLGWQVDGGEIDWRDARM
jgi:predicted esterase